MKRLYPDFEPYDTGFIQTQDGHTLYFEQSGNPDGIPLLYIHGGPGAALSSSYQTMFDGNKYRVVAFEQRGCGRSLPFGTLKNNTTEHTLRDMRQLRSHLDIDSWILFGGSWGATLALLVAIDAPDHCDGLILRGTFLARQQDRDWYLSASGGAASLFPDYFDLFVRDIEGELSSDNICAHYQHWFASSDNIIRKKALKRWFLWEERLSRLIMPNVESDLSSPDIVQAMTNLARLECHYLTHHCFIEENFILNNLNKINHLPCYIVHGRYDAICKLDAAYTLHRNWPTSEIIIVPNAGHSLSEPGISYALCRATRDMAKLFSRSFLL